VSPVNFATIVCVPTVPSGNGKATLAVPDASVAALAKGTADPSAEKLTTGPTTGSPLSSIRLALRVAGSVTSLALTPV
jgi:hypothetical protein